MSGQSGSLEENQAFGNSKKSRFERNRKIVAQRLGEEVDFRTLSAKEVKKYKLLLRKAKKREK